MFLLVPLILALIILFTDGSAFISPIIHSINNNLELYLRNCIWNACPWCRVLLIQLRNTFLLKKPSNIKGKNREISEMEFDYFLVSNICLTLSQYLILPFQNLTATRYLQLIHSFTFIYQCCFLKFIKMQNQPKKSIKIKYGSKY